MSSVTDPRVAAAFDDVAEAIGRLTALDLAPGDITDAYAHIRELEALERQLQAGQLALLNELKRSGLHKADGHASTKVMVRFAANLSPAEAKRRDKAARMLERMPLVAAAHAAGTLGGSQVDRIARTFANPRVRDELEAQDANLVVLAVRLPYLEFDAKLTDWERLADEDGAGDRAERNHRNRDFLLLPNLDGSFRVDGGFGGLQGAQMKVIHDHQIEVEFQADWAEARDRLGDAATVADLRRTDAQRRADAAEAIFRGFADALAASPGGPTIVLNLLMDMETSERGLRKLAGDDPGPDPRAATFFDDAVADLADDRDSGPGGDTDSEAGVGDATARHRVPFRSSTADGHPIDPAEALAAALVGHVRRVVIGADGVVLDMGRLRRLFTGPRKTAVQFSADRCPWPGCGVPASQCQADHLQPFNGPDKGRTCPGNGGPLCGRHNRVKEHGFTVYRDERGRLHILRPDGTEIS